MDTCDEIKVSAVSSNLRSTPMVEYARSSIKLQTILSDRVVEPALRSSFGDCSNNHSDCGNYQRLNHGGNLFVVVEIMRKVGVTIKIPSQPELLPPSRDSQNVRKP